ncbi:hypothetical protein DFH07DRAFT_800149, partial [Mycena maculata]
MPVPKHLTRCFHYDSATGKPLRGGCFRPETCRFAHPTDPEWEISKESIQTRTPQSAGKYRRSSRSRSPRRPVRPPSRSISPTRHRRSYESDPRMDNRAGTSTDAHRGSTRSSIASQSPAPPAPPKPLPPPFTAPPLTPRSLPVPPPLPAAFSASEPRPAPTLLTPEERKVKWDQILPLVADCVQAQQAHLDSVKEMENFEKMLQTQRFAKMSGTDKERVDRRLAELKSASEEKGKRVSTALKVLKDTNWWPVGPNQEGVADKYRDLIQYVSSLHSTATEMHQQYLKNAQSVSASGSTSEAPSHDPNSRPLKRRRLSADAAPSMDSADATDFEKLRDKLVALEERFAEIQNDILSLESRNEDEITAQIEAKLESISLDPSGSSELARADERMKIADAQLDQLMDAVKLLMTESEILTKAAQTLDKEEQRYPEELLALQRRFQVYEKAYDKDQKSMEAFSAALDALKARPPAPASLPLEFIITAIDEPIRDTVQATVRPIVEKMIKELDEKIAKQDAETYGKLWQKIGLTFKVMDAVS